MTIYKMLLIKDSYRDVSPDCDVFAHMAGVAG
jgi:hypothetical protein